MENSDVKRNSFAIRLGSNSPILMYDRAIKRAGILSRCELRNIFEKIVILQNEIIKDLIKYPEIFKHFNSKISDAVYNNQFLDLVHFDTNELGDMSIDEILSTYATFFEIIESANSFSELSHVIDLVKFSNDFFEELLTIIPEVISKKSELPVKLEILELYRSNVFEHNISLAVHQVQSLAYQPRFLTLDDLIQEAMVGLRKAILKYNPYLNTKFSTIATPWISAEILRAIDNKEREIAIPCNILGAYNKSIKKLNKLINEKGEILGINSIASELNDPSFYHVEIKVVDLDSHNAPSSTLGERNSLPLHEIIADENVLDTLSYLELVELKNNITKAINKLPDTQKFIIDSLFGITPEVNPITNASIMSILNMKPYEYNKVKNQAYYSLREEFEFVPAFSAWKKVLENS